MAGTGAVRQRRKGAAAPPTSLTNKVVNAFEAVEFEVLVLIIFGLVYFSVMMMVRAYWLYLGSEFSGRGCWEWAQFVLVGYGHPPPCDGQGTAP